MSIELDGCAKIGMGGHLCEGIGGIREWGRWGTVKMGGVDGVSKMGNWAFEKGIKKTPTLRRVLNMEK